MKTIQINLNEKEVKLLLKILKEAEETRSDMGCNDPYEDEEKMFKKKERIEMAKILNDGSDEEEYDGFLFNSQYVQYIIERIEQQI